MSAHLYLIGWVEDRTGKAVPEELSVGGMPSDLANSLPGLHRYVATTMTFNEPRMLDKKLYIKQRLMVHMYPPWNETTKTNALLERLSLLTLKERRLPQNA